MKKRIVSTVLAAAMAASMISGCGASGQGATEAAKTEAPLPRASALQIAWHISTGILQA